MPPPGAKIVKDKSGSGKHKGKNSGKSKKGKPAAKRTGSKARQKAKQTGKSAKPRQDRWSATNLGLVGAVMGGVTSVAASPLLNLPPNILSVGGALVGVFGVAPAVKAKLEERRQARKEKPKGDQK